MYETVRVKNKCIYAGLGRFKCYCSHVQCGVQCIHDELSIVLYSIDQMQGIKLTRLKCIRFQC